MRLSKLTKSTKIIPFASFREGKKVHLAAWDALVSLFPGSGAKDRFARIQPCCTAGKGK